MKKINILSKNVYNRIAAGEVIDRPYSAVKELIENSLDAKADDIEIYIENGGKQLIKVVDNGTGIERDDLHDAFTPHATSKISEAEDLDCITTLGFRGEALASISVIAKVEIISVTAGNPACKITCEGGKTGEIQPAALEKGTIICVRDLFYNTPVRAKFLKADKKEEADITNFVTRFILGNPAVSFRYYVDGKLMLQSFGGGLDEAVAQVYGAKTLSQCFKINAEKDGFKISGFIGNQNFFKPNKTYQSLFLNGRYIINNTIATAINNAYASYMMKRQFPFYVLNVGVPLDFVDVNVHPNKADVRFVDNRTVFGVVYSTISPILDGTARAADFVIDETRIPEIKSSVDKNLYTQEKKEEKTDIEELMKQFKEFNNLPIKDQVKIEQAQVKKGVDGKETEMRNTYDTDFTEYRDNDFKQNVFTVSDNERISPLENFKAYEIQQEYFERRKQEQQKIEFASCKFRGCLFDTYLLYEIEDKVYIIDQHAAHERLIYDRLIKKLKERNIVRQPMLIPYIFNTNPIENEFLENNIKTLRSMGIGIDNFGISSFRVDCIPMDLQNINIEEFFGEVLSQLNTLKNIDETEVFKEKIAMTACKHAIKGGMSLTESERDALFEMLDGNTGLKCPHGRPVCVTMSKKDFEKMFKRIV